MARTNSYPLTKSMQSVVYEVNNYLVNSEKMETQILRTDDGAVIVQGRVRGGKGKQFLGLDKAITVTMHEANAILVVEVGKGKWIDKVGIMALSMVVLWPLSITSGIGMYNQARLPEKIFKTVRTYLAA